MIKTYKEYYDGTDTLASQTTSNEYGLHSVDDKPSLETYFESGEVRLQCWHKDNERHRDNGPAIIRYDNQGRIITSRWFLDGSPHRDGGPSTYEMDHTRGIVTEVYHQCARYRTDGPAIISYYNDGHNTPRMKKYTNALGAIHREDGPALIWYDYDFNRIVTGYFINGRQVPKEIIEGLEDGTPEMIFAMAMYGG